MKKLILISGLVGISFMLKAQTHWESIILAEDEWRYLEATSEPMTGWNLPGFNDLSWPTGNGGFGYDDGDDATIVSNVNSVYLRKTFDVTETAVILRILLDIDYDDAFVAYLNGTEIARSFNVTDVPPVYNSTLTIDHEALMYQGGSPERFEADRSVLVNGTNLLAIQILNNGTSSSDMSALPFLQAEIDGTQQLYHPTPSWFMAPLNLRDSKLPIVIIDTEGQSIVDDPRIVATMKLVDHGPGELNSLDDEPNAYNGRITIETRGQSSQYFFPKKSYAFETQDAAGENNNVSLMGMPAENDWILYAPYSDKSLLRNAVTFGLYSQMGNYCSRTAFCEVYLNGNYEGIYILMEKIKRDENRVDIATLNPVDISGDELTGGYIFKVDKRDGDYQDGFTGFTSYPNPSYPNAADITYQYFQPEPDELATEQRQYLKDFIIEAERVLISGDFENPETGYNKYLNTSSFVDFLLINEISKEVDKYRYSSYFFKRKGSNGGEIFAGPIWDFNLGYGNVDYWDYGLQTSGWLYTQVNPWNESIIFWWKRLMEDPFFADLASSRWQYLRANQLSDEHIHQMIDSMTTLINEAVVRNYERWPILGTYVWPNNDWQNNDYTDEVDYFSNWLFNRLHWMDQNLGGPVLQPTASLSEASRSPEVFNISLSLADDQFTHTRLKNRHFTMQCDNDDLYLQSVNYVNATTATLAVASGSSSPVSSSSLSFYIDDEVLNGFRSIQSDVLLIDAIEPGFSGPQHEVYASGNSIFVRTDYPGDLPARVELINSLGQLVASYPLERSNLNNIPTGLKAGIYLVRLNAEKGIQAVKVYIAE